MNGTLNASISSTNAAYTRIKALEKELEALKSAVNVDTKKISTLQSELDSYKTAMASQVTATNVTAGSSLTSNGSTHVKTLTADEKITANQGIDSSGTITVTDQVYNKTSSIDGGSVNTSVVNTTLVTASGTIKGGYLKVDNVATIEDLSVTNSGNIVELTSNDIHAYEDITVDGDLNFPKVDSNINGEYLTVNAKDINASGDLQVKGQTVVDGSLVVKDTIAAKNIIGDLNLNDLKVQSATVTDLITKTAVSSTSAVGFDTTGKLIPIKVSGGGGTSDVAQAVETEKVILDLRNSSNIMNISESENILYASKADEDTYRLMTFDKTNTYAKLYHYSTGNLETLASMTTLLSSIGFPVAALIDDKLYYVSSDQMSIQCFDYTNKTTTTTYTSTDLKIYSFNTMVPYVFDFAGVPFALLYDDDSEEGHAIKRVVKFDGTVIAEDSEYVKQGKYGDNGDIIIPYDLGSVIYFVVVTENKRAYFLDPQSMLFKYTNGEDIVAATDEIVPIVIKQNNKGLFDPPVDGVTAVYWMDPETYNTYVFNEESLKIELVDNIKIRTDKVSLNIELGENVTFYDENNKQLATVPVSNISPFFTGFDTSYSGMYSHYICPKYEAKQNVLINNQQAALDSLNSLSVDNTPIYLDGKQVIDGRAYDYVLSSELELESLLKQLYEEGTQTTSNYKDLNIYLKDSTFLLRNSILGTLRSNKSLYGLHFYGESKNTIIQVTGFDIPDTPVEGEIKYYQLTTTYPMFERSCSFEHISIQILTGQLSTTSDFIECNITTTCSGWTLPFYGYNFDKCSLKATGTLKASPVATTNIVYAAVIANNITNTSLKEVDSTLITLIKAQHVRDCTIDISSLILANQDDSTNHNFYLMMPFSAPSDASFERNSFTDIKSSDGTATVYPLANLYGYGSAEGIKGYLSWIGFKGNIFKNIASSTKKLQFSLGAIDKINISNSASTYSKYLYRTANDFPGEYDLMTNNFITVTDRG